MKHVVLAAVAAAALAIPEHAGAQAPPPYMGAPWRPVRPRPVPYEGGPIPPGMLRITRPSWGRVIGGGATLMVTWSLTMSVGFASANVSSAFGGRSDDALLLLIIPVIGPLTYWAATDESVSATAGTLLALSAAAQTTGLVLLITGFTSPREFLVRDAYARRAPPRRWTLLPGVAGGAQGATLAGVF